MYVYDGNVSFIGGQNDGVIPDLLRPDQYRKGINVTTVGGKLGPRPSFRHRPLTFNLPTTSDGIDYEGIYRNGKCQASIPYDANDPRYIIDVVCGLIYQIDPVEYTVSIISLPEGDRLNQYARRVNWTIAGKYLVLHDYPNRPVIIDGGEARRSSADDYEVPTSTLGAFVQSRMWVANAFNEFGAGDPVGSLASPNAPVTFEESLAPAQDFNGQYFSLGSSNNNNPITAMGFLQLADTSTGYGPLIVATKKSIYSCAANTPRKNWDQAQFTSLLLYNAGIVGPRAFTNVNSDFLFVSADGQVRSLHMGRDEQRRWSNTPISREVKTWLKTNRPDLLDLTVVETFGNRVFFTCQPKVVEARDINNFTVQDYAFSGIVVLELDNASGLTLDSAKPSWSGVWTGLNPTEIINLGDRLFIKSKDYDGENRLYELSEDEDNDMRDFVEYPITSRVYSRSYDFNTRFEEKEEGSIDYTITNVEGEFEFTVERRPSSSNSWSLWKTWKHNAPVKTPSADCTLPTLEAHNFSDIDLGDPDNKSCDPITKDSNKYVRKVELRLTLKGSRWGLQDLRLKYDKKEGDNTHNIKCTEIDAVEVHRYCEVDDLDIHKLGW